MDKQLECPACCSTNVGTAWEKETWKDCYFFFTKGPGYAGYYNGVTLPFISPAPIQSIRNDYCLDCKTEGDFQLVNGGIHELTKQLFLMCNPKGIL